MLHHLVQGCRDVGKVHALRQAWLSVLRKGLERADRWMRSL